MKETLKTCPLCGEKIVFAYNKSTKLGYYKCSNTECHFRMGMNYSEKEVSLQGIELSTECRGCGNPLTVANGPKGLYATCLRCDFDLRPNMLAGFIYRKHANAHNLEAQEEIKALEREYKGIVDENYSYDDFAIPEEIVVEEIQEATKDENVFENVNREEFIEYYNKGYTINQLSQHFNIARSQTRGIKKALLAEGAIKTYVNQKHGRTSVACSDSIVEEVVEEIFKDKSTKDTKEAREGSALQNVINYMKEHLNTKLGIEELHEATGILASTIGNYLTQLRKTGLVKIVGYKETFPLTLLYQVTESPLEAIPYKTFEEGYITLGKFFRENKEILKSISKSLTPTIFRKAVEESNLIDYLIMTEKGLSKGYNEKDLRRFVKKYYKVSIPVKGDSIEEVKEVIKKEYKPKTEVKENVTEANLAPWIQSALEKTLSIFNEDTNKPYSSKDLSDKLGLNLTSSQILLKRLRLMDKIKVVGNEGSKVLYQVVESALPEVDVSNKDGKYKTLYGFANSYKKLGMPPITFIKKAEKENLISHPILTRAGISKGYDVEELKELVKRYNSVKVVNADIDNTSEPHHDSIPKVIPSTPRKGLSGILSSLFQHKSEDTEPEELISF